MSTQLIRIEDFKKNKDIIDVSIKKEKVKEKSSKIYALIKTTKGDIKVDLFYKNFS